MKQHQERLQLLTLQLLNKQQRSLKYLVTSRRGSSLLGLKIRERALQLPASHVQRNVVHQLVLPTTRLQPKSSEQLSVGRQLDSPTKQPQLLRLRQRHAEVPRTLSTVSPFTG
jgi:hypothetical protein